MNLELLQKKLEEVKSKKIELISDLKKRELVKPVIRVGKSNWWSYESQFYTSASNDRLNFNIPDDGHIYFSYLENNLVFSAAPKYSLPYQGETLIHFEGTVTNSLEAVLFIIEYKNNKKTKISQIKLNEQKVLDLNGTSGIRVAIKFKGKGKFSLNRLSLGNEIIQGFQTVSNNIHTELLLTEEKK
ncbi:hypothetical protein AWM68_13335 [Fictibacillus phosphorivorans]|uniref:Uncharacterized protein n=1 Tax=Fictibacillus phosphorivorans TaxID=1221500 RepID=A0A165MZX5_9BACL|nr:hypothetical protein [Fictibacillus phosphorivorans]KZE64084.1 hypothetical protein AWM68_13335 [Fictibacillus phosphorivorans]